MRPIKAQFFVKIMPDISYSPLRILTCGLFLFAHLLFAQKADVEVTRCNAIDRALPVKNVSLDATGRRWAANNKGVVQIKTIDLSVPLTIASGDRNVLSYHGGNADFTWTETQFQEQVNTPCSVTAAWLDTKNHVLWLGTDEAGLFQFSTEPTFKMVQQYLPVNSKLKSNHITHIFQDATSRLWIGNEGGIMYGTPGRWKNDLNGFAVQRVREFNTVIYVLADGAISKAPGGEKWSDLALEERYLEGDIRDFDIDATGKMWIVSGNITRFDMVANTYDEFGGADYYTSQYGNCIAVDADGAAWIGTEDKGLFNIDMVSNMVLTAYVEQPISCEGNGKDAVVLAKVSGGIEPYTYAWSGGLSGEAPRNIGAGLYTVTVTDSKGKIRTADVSVLDARLKLKVRQKKPASGPGIADGSAEVDIATNASGISILWDNGEVMVTATKLAAGEHKVAVTDPKGCAMTLTVMIAVAGQPLVLTLTPEINIMCAGGKVPLLAKVDGGKPPYTFSWNNSGLSGDKVNVSAGKYALTVTDATGTTATASYNLTQPEPLTVTAMAQTVSSAGGADGKAIAQAKGGSGTYAFKWDNGETSFSATKLTAGSHTVIVSDAHGCVANATVRIEAKIDGFAVILREARPIKCYGEQTNLSVAAVGGKTPYKEYIWSPNIKSAAQSVDAGDYAVTATDAAGTTATATITVVAPQELLASAIPQSATNAGEDNGKALVTIKGGTGAMSFNWDNGEITAATNHLSAGLHRVTVTDENGCTATATVTITEGVLPLTMVVSEVKAITCAGEKAALEIQVIGGKGPFNYAWSNPAIVGGRPNVLAGDYSVTMTDMAGTKAVATISVKQPAAMVVKNVACSPANIGASDGKAKVIFEGGASPRTFSWDNGETTEEAIRLSAGTHVVTATDANGCSVTATAEVTENVRSLTVTLLEKTPIKCTGQKAGLVLNVSGGKAPFRYAWSNPALSGEAPSGLDVGDYAVTVTDAKGSTQTAAIAVKAPSALAVELTRNIGATAERNDGKAEIAIKGGTPKYSILWDTKQNGLSAPKLPFGKHSVTVTDANGCVQKIDFETEKRILPELTGTLESGQTIRMRLLNFDTDSSALKSDALPMLDELYDFMTEHAAVVIEVAGHTNNQPSDAFADQLSTARAKAVADYLFAKGVDPKRVQYKGYGKRLPLVPNTSPEGRRTNQRVEIKILRVKQ